MVDENASAGTAEPANGGNADPLDTRWVLEVQGCIYGPYTGHALKEYAAEGRLAPYSTVARTGKPAGQEVWMPAGEDPVLAPLFEGLPAYRQPAGEEAKHEAKSDPNVSYGPRRGQVDRRSHPTTFNLLVIADVKSRSSGPLEGTILSLGPAFKVASNVWAVHTSSSAPDVVNALTRHLGSTDKVFVVDATRNRTAWFNMGPETDAKIRQVWKSQ